MSNPPPPSDPAQPYDPTTPLGAMPPGDPAPTGTPLPPRPPGWSPHPDAGTPAAPPGSSPAAGGTPSYQPGYARPGYPQPDPHYPHPQYPDPQHPAPSYPATAAFPAYETQPTGYPPGAYPPGQQPYAMAAPEPPPRRSNVPLVAVIVAVSLLLCGGVAVAGVLAVRNVVDRTKEAVRQIPTVPPMPSIPAVPTELPDLPTELPDLPGLPGDDDADAPGAPTGRTVTVVYEVTGDGAADISYTAELGKSLKRVKNAKLPWRTEVSVPGTTYISVIALRTGTTEGTIRCRATVDGKEVASREAQGTFAIATCSKLVVG